MFGTFNAQPRSKAFVAVVALVAMILATVGGSIFLGSARAAAEISAIKDVTVNKGKIRAWETTRVTVKWQEPAKGAAEGDFFTMKMPAQFAKVGSQPSIPLTSPEGVKFGSISWKGDNAKAVFNKNIEKYDDVRGTVFFEMKLKKQNIVEPGPGTYTFKTTDSEINVDIEVLPAKEDHIGVNGERDLHKFGSWTRTNQNAVSEGALTWRIALPTFNKNIPGPVVITDTVRGNAWSPDCDSFRVYQGNKLSGTNIDPNGMIRLPASAYKISKCGATGFVVSLNKGIPAGKYIDITYTGTVVDQDATKFGNAVNVKSPKPGIDQNRQQELIAARSGSSVNGRRSVQVGDYVWHDLNNNGKQDAGEPGIAGVELKLQKVTGGKRVGAQHAETINDDGYAYVAGAAVANVKTDAKGLYGFKNLQVLKPGEKYVVTIADDSAARKLGLAPTITLNGGNGADDSSKGEAISVADLTKNAAKDLTLDFGYASAPAVSVGDYTWIDANGNGIQDAGEAPLAGVEVKIVKVGAKGETPALSAGKIGEDGKPVAGPAVQATAVTNAKGVYGFSNLEALTGGEKYRVCVTEAGYKVARDKGLMPTVSLNGGNGENDSSTGCATSVKPLAVNGAKDLSLDFGFRPVPKVAVGDYVWIDSNGNGIQDAGEPGIEGVELELVKVLANGQEAPALQAGAINAEGNLVAGPAAKATAATNAKGIYGFSNLEALKTGESYRVSLTAKGIETLRAKGLTATVSLNGGTGENDSSTGHALTQKDLTNGGSDLSLDFGFVPVPAVQIGDFVWRDTNANGIQDAGEPGIEGVELKVVKVLADGTEAPAHVPGEIGPKGSYVQGPQAQALAVTNADGIYDFGKLETLKKGERYKVSITDNGYGKLSLLGLTATVSLNGGTGENDSSTGHALSQKDLTVSAKDLSLDFGFIPVGKVAVGDYVWLDTNKDGLQDADEPGISGIELKIVKVLADGTETPALLAGGIDANGQLQPGPAAPATTVTNDEGIYGFGKLEALTGGDKYRVCITEKGYGVLADKRLMPTVSLNGGNGENDSSTGCALTVKELAADGATDLSLDFGFIPVPQVTVGDYVWDDANGNGLQDTDETGIEGVELKIVKVLADGTEVPAREAGTWSAEGTLNEGPEAKATVLTDSAGTYYFEGLEALKTGETYKVSLTEKGNATIADAGLVPTVSIDGGIGETDSSTGYAVTQKDLTSGGSDLTLDFGFRAPATVSVGDYVWHDADKDGLQGENEVGLAGVELSIQKVKADGTKEAARTADKIGADGNLVAGDKVQNTKTNPAGAYAFTGLQPLAEGENYQVCVTEEAETELAKAGYSRTISLNEGKGEKDSSNGCATNQLPLTQAGQADNTLDFGYKLVEEGTLSDEVTADSAEIVKQGTLASTGFDGKIYAGVSLGLIAAGILIASRKRKA